jgi:RNA polymerase sigma-70 factor (ECF subfamily)
MTGNAPDLSREESDTLVVLARSGNDQAFAELVSRHQSKLRNLFRRLCNNPALADDLAQQAFLEAWRSIKNLRSSGAFGAWLKKVAINTWLKHSRSKDPLNAVEDRPDMSAIVERSPIDEEIDLDRALAVLSKAERLCLVLSYHQGMSHGSIAEFTGMPLGTVKSHINRGIQQLRESLKIYESDLSSENSGNKT